MALVGDPDSTINGSDRPHGFVPVQVQTTITAS